MPIDVRSNDLLMLNATSEQYIVISASHIPRRKFSPMWNLRLTEDCTLLRAPYVGSTFKAYRANVSGLKCMRLMTDTVVLQADDPMDTPRQIKLTYLKSPDGDEVVELRLGDVG